MNEESLSKLFQNLYAAKNEQDVDEIIQNHPDIFKQKNWFPYGENESNFGVIENQQSNPVAALVEKLTNSIDAVLMRKCYESDIKPKSSLAPESVKKAVEIFFPNHKSWDLHSECKKQAEDIQLIADSQPRNTANTSLVVYDNGEGQYPEDFEKTFLSLLRGNKNEIHFVQGKYNMGGSGGIVFCGRKRYQLIASKRYDKIGKFGFTLIRRHPLNESEAKSKKNTWYEFLKIDGKIPAFNITELDLGLYKKSFETGTIIKLYSYDLKGNRHIARDLNRSINEYLYEPALPIYTIEKSERYPKDRNLERELYGLKRRLESRKDIYIEETFSETFTDKQIGNVKVTVHVFKARAKDKKPSETKKTIQKEFFKNNMAVLFSINGQVHGHYTSEFITRSLKFHLLRDYVLIHVNCTNMNYDFRTELFMASRDRLKDGEESKILRNFLASNLKKGRLKEIYKKRKNAISVDNTDSEDLLKSFAENLPLNDELRHLIDQTFKLDKENKKPASANKPEKNQPRKKKEPVPFNPNRFPSFFKLDLKKKGDKLVVALPLNGEKTVKFSTDIENEYFDRVEEPGNMKVSLLGYKPNDVTGGDKKGEVKDVGDILNIAKRSPHDGTIKVIIKPTDEVQVGDEIQIQADLSSPGEDFSVIFWVKISDPVPPKEESDQISEDDERIGLPKHILIYKESPDDRNLMTWEKLEESGITMDYETVIHPEVNKDDMLDVIYINMDSSVLKSYKSKIRNLTIEQNELADKRYISALYCHTLFLYIINKKKDYKMVHGEDDKGVDLTEYLTDLFSSYYAAFLMNFGMGELIEGFGA